MHPDSPHGPFCDPKPPSPTAQPSHRFRPSSDTAESPSDPVYGYPLCQIIFRLPSGRTYGAMPTLYFGQSLQFSTYSAGVGSPRLGGSSAYGQCRNLRLLAAKHQPGGATRYQRTSRSRTTILHPFSVHGSSLFFARAKVAQPVWYQSGGGGAAVTVDGRYAHKRTYAVRMDSFSPSSSRTDSPKYPLAGRCAPVMQRPAARTRTSATS